MERHDRGKSWGIEEEDMLVECWSREEVKDKLDGTVRGVVAHEIIGKVIIFTIIDSSVNSITSIQNKIKALKKKVPQHTPLLTKKVAQEENLLNTTIYSIPFLEISRQALKLNL